jgi:hypothetical protein
VQPQKQGGSAARLDLRSLVNEAKVKVLFQTCPWAHENWTAWNLVVSLTFLTESALQGMYALFFSSTEMYLCKDNYSSWLSRYECLALIPDKSLERKWHHVFLANLDALRQPIADSRGKALSAKL